MLRRAGMVCSVASDGAEAVALWKGGGAGAGGAPALDLVLMDLMMPAVNGIEAATQARGPRGILGGCMMAQSCNA